MASEDARQKALETAQKLLSDLSKIDPKTLDRTSDLSAGINFKDAVPDFMEMLELCKQLNERDLSRLPKSQLGGIVGACNKILAHIVKVEGFQLNVNTPGNVCTEIITGIKASHDAVVTPLLLPLAFTATQSTDYAKIEREAKGYHTTLKTTLGKFKEDSKSGIEDIEKVLIAVRGLASDAGVSSNAQFFLDDSEMHEGQAQTWLRWTIVTAVATFGVAVAALVTAFLYHPDTTAEIVQYVVAKLLVLSTLSFGVIWCARNYKAQKHNETLNKHRANALRTFRTFVEGTKDERVKDAILLQAAHAAFSGRSTGYDSTDNDSQTISPVIELIGKNIPQSSG